MICLFFSELPILSSFEHRRANPDDSSIACLTSQGSLPSRPSFQSVLGSAVLVGMCACGLTVAAEPVNGTDRPDSYAFKLRPLAAHGSE